MMAKRPNDRPHSMTEVIAFLEASHLPADDAMRTARPVARPHPGPIVSSETPSCVTPSPEPKTGPSIRVRREEGQGFDIDQEFNLEELVGDESIKPLPAVHKSRTTAMPLKRTASPAIRARSRETAFTLSALAGGLLLTAFVGFIVMSPVP